MDRLYRQRDLSEMARSSTVSSYALSGFCLPYGVRAGRPFGRVSLSRQALGKGEEGELLQTMQNLERALPDPKSALALTNNSNIHGKRTPRDDGARLVKRVQPWVKWWHGEMDCYLTQSLTGYGC